MQVNCLGFDPAYAKPTAWAWQFDRGLWSCGKTPTKAGDPFGFMSDLSNDNLVEITHVVCENVYMGRNPSIMAGLARVQGNIEFASLVARREFVLVNTSTWAKILPAMEDGKRPRKRKDIIKGAIIKAQELTGRDTLSEDESVAVCIAHWGNENLKGER